MGGARRGGLGGVWVARRVGGRERLRGEGEGVGFKGRGTAIRTGARGRPAGERGGRGGGGGREACYIGVGGG